MSVFYEYTIKKDCVEVANLESMDEDEVLFQALKIFQLFDLWIMVAHFEYWIRVNDEYLSFCQAKTWHLINYN